MNKRNLIIQAAVASAFAVASFSASAGVANGYPQQMAIQAVTGTTSPAAIVTGQLAYSTVAPIPVGTSYVYVKLNGGALFLQAAGGTITGGGADTAGVLTTAGALAVANAGVQTTVVVGAGTVSADTTFIVFPITVTNASVPVNTTFTYSPGVTAALGALSTVPAAVVAGGTLTGSISIGTVASTAAGGSALTTSTNVDTPASGSLLQFVPGETFTSMSSGASTFSSTVVNGGMVGVGVETAQINVTTAAGVSFINNVNVAASTSLINFGGFYFADIPAASNVVGASGAAFNIATNYTAATSSAVVTGNFGAAAGTGGKVFISSANNCTAMIGTAGVLTASNTVATISTLPAFVTSVPAYVCMQLNTGNAIPVPATTPSVAVTMVGTTTATANFSGSGTLYPLTTNGGSVYVRSYIPSAASGYTSFIRVINTGGIAANISAAVVNATTGVTGTSAVIASNVAAGGAVTIPSSVIDAALGAGAPAAGDRPRLLITGPTTLSVQSFFLSNANGNFNEVSSGNNVAGTAGQ